GRARGGGAGADRGAGRHLADVRGGAPGAYRRAGERGAVHHRAGAGHVRWGVLPDHRDRAGRHDRGPEPDRGVHPGAGDHLRWGRAGRDRGAGDDHAGVRGRVPGGLPADPGPGSGGVSAAWAVTVVELRRFLRDRSNIFFTFIFPLLLVVVIGAQFGGGTDSGRVVLGDDSSALGQRIATELHARDVTIQVAQAGQVQE